MEERRVPDARARPLPTEHDRRPHGGVLRHRPGARPADHHRERTPPRRDRRFFDFRSPLAAYAQTSRGPTSILQRINLGLFALLGELSATADWRGIAEEIWPFVQGPPTTPMGEAEAGWRAAVAGRATRVVRPDYCRANGSGGLLNCGNRLKGRRYLVGV